MKVKVHLYTQSQPIEMYDVKNTYTKDGLYCVLYNDIPGVIGGVDKFPLQHIFRIREASE